MTGQSLDITLSQGVGVELTTRSGVMLKLRPVSATDADLVDRFFEGLTAEDLQFRFLSAQPQLTGVLLSSMIDIDHRHREHLLAFVGDDELVASLMIAADPGCKTAEVAIAVTPALKGCGVGWSLLHHAIDLARERGIKRLQAIESRANRRAIEIEHDLGFKSSDYDGDATLALLQIDL